VAPVVKSLAEAYVHPGVAWPRLICADVTLWGSELPAVDGFSDAVAEHLVRVVRQGVESAVDVSLTEPATH